MSTFGNNSVYATKTTGIDDYKVATQVQLTVAGTISSLSAYVSNNDAGNATSYFRLGLYSDTGGNAPNALVAQCDPYQIAGGTAANWITRNLQTPYEASAGYYWICVQGEATNAVGVSIYYQVGTLSRAINWDAYSDGLAATWAAPTIVANRDYSMYGTYSQGFSGLTVTKLIQG